MQCVELENNIVMQYKIVNSKMVLEARPMRWSQASSTAGLGARPEICKTGILAGVTPKNAAVELKLDICHRCRGAHSPAAKWANLQGI